MVILASFIDSMISCLSSSTSSAHATDWLLKIILVVSGNAYVVYVVVTVVTFFLVFTLSLASGAGTIVLSLSVSGATLSILELMLRAGLIHATETSAVTISIMPAILCAGLLFCVFIVMMFLILCNK